MDREIKIDLGRCFRAVFRKWWLIAISTVVFITLGLVFTNTVQVPIYYSEATVYSMAYGSYQEALEGASVMKTYADIVSSRKVAERAALIIGDDTITAQTIQAMVEVDYVSSSPILTISATSFNPELTIKVANAVADAFIIEVKNITGSDSVQLLDSAVDSKVFNNGGMSRGMKRTIAGLVGVLLPCMIIFLKEILTTKLYSVDDASLNGKMEIIGFIPAYEKL